MYRHTYAEINLKAIENNIKLAKSVINRPALLLAVVKSNAYGHSANEVARKALSSGADCLAVAIAEEAVVLRENGINCPILVLGVSSDEQVELALSFNLDLCVASVHELQNIINVSKGRFIKIHIKADTGMGRIGFSMPNELDGCFELLRNHPNIHLTGLFSHLACADDVDSRFSYNQFALFQEFKKKLNTFGYYPCCHICNSAGIFRFNEMHEDMVRFGISLYGYAPSVGFMPEICSKLEPAMNVFSEIVFVKEVPEGSCISYGATYIAPGKRKIATIPIGYGDGYNRLLSNRGKMIVLKQDKAYLADVVGRVCMDQTMIDVTEIPNVSCGDKVLVLGRVNDLRFDADDMASLCNTISYEVLLSFNSRIPRRFVGAE